MEREHFLGQLWLEIWRSHHQAVLSFHHLRQKVAVLVQVFSDVFRCFHVFSKIVRDKLCLNLSTTVDVLSWQGLPRLRCQLQWGKPFCPTCWFRNLYDVVLKYERRDFSAFFPFWRFEALHRRLDDTTIWREAGVDLQYAYGFLRYFCQLMAFLGLSSTRKIHHKKNLRRDKQDNWHFLALHSN